MAEDEVSARRAKRTPASAASDEHAIDLGNAVEGDTKAPMIGPWLMAQHLHSNPECAAAARAIMARWELRHTPVARILRAFTQEDSEHLRGLRTLLDEYREAYGIEMGEDYVTRAVGVAGALMPTAVEYCTRCPREAVPGTGLCGRHGGQWIDDETRTHLGRQIADNLIELSMRATRTLADLMDNAGSEKVRYDAAVAILDRAGLGAVTKVEHSFDIDSAQKANEVVRARIDRLAQNIPRLPALPVEEIQEAEVIG